MLVRLWTFLHDSMRNRLMVLLPLVAAVFFVFPLILYILSSQQEMHEHLATIAAQVDNAFVAQLFRRQFLMVMGLSLAALVSLGVVIASLTHVITKPIYVLSLQTEKMARGDAPLQSVEVQSQSGEVRRLATGLNHFISEIDRHQQELAAQRVHAAIGKLTTHIAHDLRSPLASLSIALEYFRGVRSVDSRMKDHVDLLNLSSKRLTSIAEGLLTKHKANGDDSATSPVSFPLHPLLKELLHEFTLQAPQIQFVTEGDTEKITLKGSPMRFQRALGNLIKNAVEAMEGQGSLTLRTTTASDHAIITVTDTGKGMTTETLSKILHGGHSEGKTDGHGIGMMVVRETIEAMKGTLEAQSTVGQGTTFTITLPLSKSVMVSEANPSPEHEPPTKSNTSLTAMVVDDDENIRLAWKFRFKPLGITDLHCYASMEAATSNGLDLASIDLAFIDKHIEDSAWSLPKTITHLKERGVKKIIIASGDSATSLREDPECSEADGISSEKIPKSLQEWV